MDKLQDLLPKSIKLNKLQYTEYHDRIFTHLILQDYDWMYYRMQAEIPYEINGHKIMLVEFKYVGCVVADMTVQIGEDIVKFDFSSDIFDEYLKEYLNLMQDSLNKKETFYAGSLIVRFYNEIMKNHTTIHTPPERIDKIYLPQQ